MERRLKNEVGGNSERIHGLFDGLLFNWHHCGANSFTPCYRLAVPRLDAQQVRLLLRRDAVAWAVRWTVFLPISGSVATRLDALLDSASSRAPF